MKHLLSLVLLGTFTLPLPAAQWEALPKTPPIPQDNPQSKEKVSLGQILYFDPRLSSTGTVSCNSCHNVMLGGDDNRPTSFGVHGKQGGRSAPSVWNAAFLSVQFWDGRAASLEEQAKGPVTNPVEMGMSDWDAVIKRLQTIPGYEPLFKTAFPKETTPLTADNAAKAIAAYERTLITPNSPYDRYVQGNKKALTEEQVKGMETVAALGCLSCHSGPNFSGTAKMGEGFFMKFPTTSGTEYDTRYELSKDLGRYEVTKKETDKNLWRVPTWRNVALTAPYFHNGKVSTLEEAVKVMAKTQLNKDPDAAQVANIVAFLNSLTGEFPKQTLPRLPGTVGKSVISE